MIKLIKEINPFIRFAAKLKYTEARKPSKTYDCKILYILEGSGTISVNKKTHQIVPDMLIFFQPATLYSFNPSSSFYAIAIDFDLTQDFSDKKSIFPFISESDFIQKKAHPPINAISRYAICKNMKYIEPYLNEVCNEWKLKKTLYEETASSLLKYIIFKIISFENENSKVNSVSDKILNYISKNYDKKITNKRIADEFNYNPCYLNRVIISATGKSLHQYVMDFRVNTALKLLISTEFTIEEIALKTGFNSISHFSSCFKNTTGNPPSYYRK